MKKIKKTISNNLYMVKMLATFSPRYIIFSLFVGLFRVYDIAVSIYLIRYLIGAIMNHDKSTTSVVLWLVILCAIKVILTGIESYYNNIFLPKNQITFRKKFHTELFDRICKMDYKNYDTPEYYDEYSYVIGEAENRIFGIFSSIRDFIIAVIQIVFVLLSVIYVFKEPIIICFPIVIVLVNTVLFNKASTVIFQRNQENITPNRRIEYVKRVFYLKDYAKAMRLTKVSNLLKRDFQNASSDSINIFTSYGKKILGYNMALTVLYNVFSQFGLLAYLFIKAILGLITVADFSGLYAAAGSLLQAFEGLSGIVKSFYQNDLYIEKFKSFYQSISDIELNEKGNSIDLSRGFEKITVNHLSFAYDNGGRNVLDDICLEIRRGEKISIVGENGAGKSTLMDILLRLYKPTKGSICIDGTDVENFKEDEYRNMFNVVPQMFNIFATTVGENIKLDILSAGDSESLQSTLDDVELNNLGETNKEIIAKQMTREFDENGLILSGGQMQKIAIARLFVRNNPIIIMDEPSSALDPVSEYNIFKKIFEKFKDYTIVFISHRLYVSALSDKVIVMKNGKIIESGTHNELLEKGQEYAELYRITTENYKMN